MLTSLGQLISRCKPIGCRVLSHLRGMSPKPQVVFVLGGPGSGKGTQCQKICKEFNYVHLSAGDLLREERTRPNSEFGELIETHIRNGTIVPVAITCRLLANAMKKHSISRTEGGDQPDVVGDTVVDGGRFLIDGFPRNMDNLQGWKKEMADSVIVKFVLYFDCPTEVCVERCIKRGLSGSGRSDDNEESLRKRIDTYLNATMPIIEIFDEMNLVKKISASGSPDEVYQQLRVLFSE